MGWKPQLCRGIGYILVAFLIIHLIGVQSAIPNKINQDPDLVFEDAVIPSRQYLLSKRSAAPTNSNSPSKISHDEEPVAIPDLEENVPSMLLHSDNDIDDTNTEENHWLVRSVRRIKRGLSKLFNTEKLLNSDDNENNENKPMNVTKPHKKNHKKRLNGEKKKIEKSHKAHNGTEKRLRGEKRQQNGELRNHPKKEKKIKQKQHKENKMVFKEPPRPKRQYDLDDDEDNEISGSGAHTTTTNLDDRYATLFRVQFIWDEMWLPEFENKGSAVFKNVSRNLGDAIVNLYREKFRNDYGRVSATLVNVEKEDAFKVLVTFDLTFEDAQSASAIDTMIFKEIENNRKIGDYNVDSIKYQFRPFEVHQTDDNANNDIDEEEDFPDEGDEYEVELDQCNDTEFRCTSGQCVPKSYKCDNSYDCDDGSDEKNCSTDNTIHSSTDKHTGDTDHDDYITDFKIPNEHTDHSDHTGEASATEEYPTEPYVDEENSMQTTTPYNNYDDIENSETKSEDPNYRESVRTTPRSIYDESYPSERYPAVNEYDNRYPSEDENDDRDDNDRYPEERFPDESENENRYPEERYPEERYPGERYPEVHYNEDRYPEERYHEERYPEERYPEESQPDDRYATERQPAERYPEEDRRSHESYPTDVEQGRDTDNVEGRDQIIDKCRSDDKQRCPNSPNVLICSSHFCDGNNDCPDGEDEDNCPDCESNEFACDLSRCISMSHRCNGNIDCDDKTDEQNCPPLFITNDCRPDEFKCNDGLCIDGDARCNQETDCVGGEDELGCPCTEDEFRCERDGVCIEKRRVCDGESDCTFNEDEEQCDTELIKIKKQSRYFCPNGKFTCGDKTCISIIGRCDGKIDCPNDASDEDDCPCGNNNWQCDYGQCINITLRCNGNIDCPEDISDERFCIENKKKKCHPDEFQCDDKTCIALKLKCNGNIDCPDYSDEKNCHETIRKCLNDEFQCRNKACIKKTKQCNNVFDCLTGEDEFNCKCLPEQFKCKTGPGCIDNRKKCNNINDCWDKSDETNCEEDTGCLDTELFCDGMCLSNEFICDGASDCTDHTDEMNCSNKNQDKCNSNEFQCHNGLCINNDRLCNGYPDCLDSSDEQRCSSCIDNAFHCRSGECIADHKRCDNVQDCNDLSDEINCEYDGEGYETDEEEHNTTPSGLCGPSEWQCKNGMCIQKSFLCDQMKDCIDGSDEADCDEPSTEQPTRPITCGYNEFYCDGVCFDNSHKCDNLPDCLDGSDEYGCPATTPTTYRPRCPEHECDGGRTCYSDSQRCDKYNDCRDGADEERCPTECRAEEWRCDNGDCIAESAHCDRRYDCSDYSDERDCETTTRPPTRPTQPPRCRANEWQCNNGECIPLSSLCNNRPDCRDYSDERNCKEEEEIEEEEIGEVEEVGGACPVNYFRCENGPCIPEEYRCNGRVDCPYDVSDELDCSITKPTPRPDDDRQLMLKTYPNEQIIKERRLKEGREVVFQCRDEGPLRARVRWTRPNGLPMPAGYRDNNGRLELPNIKYENGGEYICEAEGYPKYKPGSSITVYLTVEKYTVPSPLPSACQANQATCMNGDCIPKDKICDGVYDCPDASDESHCSNKHGCEPNEFRCRNNKCVLKTWRCDGENDCGDKSDEENCPTLSPNAPCEYHEFQCRNRQCIPKSYQCDTHPDCMDTSDEIGCAPPTVIQPPPPMVTLPAGSVFNITCRAIGVPVPLIVWRLNWGHIPEKCETKSVDGFGQLTCENIEVKDSGAYSCEIINSMGTHFVSPDTILIVNDNDEVCPNGLFNAKARREDECINCFCFGVSTQCKSADLFTYSMPPPVTTLNIVGVDGPWNNADSIRIEDYKTNDLLATRHGVQMRLSEVNFGALSPYYSLPNEYHGNQLKSYGGFFRYDVEYQGSGRRNDAPDVILAGNGYTLVHSVYNRIEAGIRNSVNVQFTPGNWRKSDGSSATREEIMMTLANVQNILIKLQYVDQVQREVELLNIVMDSAANRDMGLGSASLVEECRCPNGYSGLSCESCAAGYVRQESGLWLGRCVREEEPCRPGTYGDPSRGIPCKQCACPLTNKGNNFASTCSLGRDNDIICNCETGYTGRRCEECAPGYTGNPMAYGGACQPIVSTTCDPRGTAEVLSNGNCVCKKHVTGHNCDQCESSAFYLNPKSETGCIDCFCMGVTKQCTSSSWYRDTIQGSFTNNRNDISLISNYDNPVDASQALAYESRSLKYRGRPDDTNVYYWSLPTRFLGDKISAYGGNLNYSISYKPLQGGFMSRNNAADVVIKSKNDITILYFRRNEMTPTGSKTFVVPILEDNWQRPDGILINREHLLMALADVDGIYIKATYTTSTEEAGLSQVSLDIATPRNNGEVRASEVEECICPPGHIGLSCEDCAPGYTRSEEGIYLALCEPCDCNGHSDECDPDTGACMNCRDNTEGDSCERCAFGFTGNASIGCLKADSQLSCAQYCDPRGFSSCDNGNCQCKSKVTGSRCDQCREGTFNLRRDNPQGCSDCFCSGVTTLCSTSSRMGHQEIPIPIFDNAFSITDYDNTFDIDDANDITSDLANNKVTYHVPDDSVYYWNLPESVTGNQILSYGGNLSFTQDVISSGSYVPNQDVIMRGNDMTLFATFGDYERNFVSVPFIESAWQVIDRSGPRQATREDLLTVMSNVQSLLVRATTHTRTSEASISDVVLATSIQQSTGPMVNNIELCRCPSGYRGTSCESCDTLYYRDKYDRSAGLSGACKKCPCGENTESCSLDNYRHVKCTCKPGYSGDLCEYRGPVERPTSPPYNLPPTISVTISKPTLQIVEVGHTVHLTCAGINIITQIPISVKWFKYDGSFTNRVSEDQGKLTIRNTQIDDSGIYVCQGSSGVESVQKNITVSVGGENPRRPSVSVYPPYINADENDSAEMTCTVDGTPRPVITWERIDGPLPSNVYINEGFLRFNQLSHSNVGQYRCIARNQVGEAEQTVHVYVRESPTRPPPEIRDVVISPSYYTGQPGVNAQFVCSSPNAISYIWTKQQTPSLPNNIYMSRGTMVIQNPRREDSGVYICVVEYNDGSSEQQMVRVNIESQSTPPKISPIKEDHVVIQGTDHSVTCEATGNPYPTIKWTKLHEPFDSNVQQSGNVLRILNAKQVNRGIYVCRAENEGGVDEISTIIEIEPREAPVLELYPKEPQIIRIGESAMLNCRAKQGIPSPTIKWTRRDRRPLSMRFKEEYAGTITLHDATLEDGGEYECHAENLAGTALLTATLTIQQSPEIRLSPNQEQIYLTEGDELKLECNAEGVPTPHAYWITPQSSTAMELPMRYTPDAFAQPWATLNKYNVRKADEGQYKCVAKNAAGEEHRYVQVIVKPKRGDVGNDNDDDEDESANTVYGGYPTDDRRPQRPDDRRPQRPDDRRPQRPDDRRPQPSDDRRPYRPDDRRPQRPDDDYDDRRRPTGSIARPGQPAISQPYKIPVGDQAILSCRVENMPTSTHWRRADGRPLPRGTIKSSGDLIIENTQLDASGKYECVVTEYDNSEFALVVAEIIVIQIPTISFSPSMPMTVRSGDNVVIHCNATGEQPIRVEWHTSDRQPLPRSIRVRGTYLEFHAITPVDAGRYFCTAENVHGNVTKVAEVIVSNRGGPGGIVDHPPFQQTHEVTEGDTISLNCGMTEQELNVPGARFNWRREYGDIPQTAVYDQQRLILRNIRPQDTGRYICQMTIPGGLTTQNYVEVTMKPGEKLPLLRLEPSRSFLKPGESLEVDCTSSAGPDAVVTWERTGGQQLPYNFQQIGNRLRIENVQGRDTGHYTCKCYTDENQVYSSDYELVVEDNPNMNEVRPPKVEHAEVGSTVVLRCNSDKYPASFLWSRQQGQFAPGQDITTSNLHLSDVQAKDAGTYICTAMHDRLQVQIPTILVVTGTLPHFPQSPLSYMVYPKLDGFMKFNFEITFKPERPNGLILYNGQKRGGNGDYISLSLNDGYPEFRFDFGQQPIVLRAMEPITLGKWHTIIVNRIRIDGFMMVDDQEPVQFPVRVRFQGLELDENLYLGSVPKFDDIASTATEHKEGFVGCVSRLILLDREIELNQDAIFIEGITSCESCTHDTCMNDGVCLETQTMEGFTCVCNEGFTGKHCSLAGKTCSTDRCTVGRCINTDVGFDCLCPLNRTGETCSVIEHLDENNLSFRDGSYAAYTAPKATKLNIKFRMRPDKLENGVVLYVAESERALGDFAAVVIQDKHLEFRINSGRRFVPVVVRSAAPLELNKWVDVTVGRRHGEAFMQIDSEPEVTGRGSGPARSMYFKTHLFIGGYDKRLSLNIGVGATRGYDGCIAGLEISSQPVNMVTEILDGVNIQNCGEISDLESDNQIHGSESGNCRPGFTGERCDIMTNICAALNPCDNGGICITKDNGFECDCLMGFTGDTCQHVLKLELSGHFRGNGYIELNRTVLSNSSTQLNTGVAILFSTTHQDGLLLWYGQHRGVHYDGQDYVSLAVVDGYLEFSFRLDGEEEIIKNLDKRVDDGNRHVAIIKRNGNQGSLEVNHFSQYGESRPTSKSEMIIPGHLFIGGAPDIINFTGNRYEHGFSGCVHIVEPIEGGPINLSTNAISALNVDSCPDSDDEDFDLGTDPPVV